MKVNKFFWIALLNVLFGVYAIRPCSWCETWNASTKKPVNTISQEPSQANSSDISNTSLDQQKSDFVSSFFANDATLNNPPVEEENNDEINSQELQELQNQMEALLKNMQALFKEEQPVEDAPSLNENQQTKSETKPIINPVVELHDVKSNSDVAAKKFYHEYLARFFPKALVINDYFFEMCPLAVLGAFTEFVTMLTDETWFVFKNKKEQYRNSEHWEIILDECKRLDTSLQYAYINVSENTVVDGTKLTLAQRNKSIPLKQYWIQNGITSFYDFYAYYADYAKRMFNLGIMSQNLAESHSFSRRYAEVLKDIPESLYDGTYHEHQKINNELLARLRKNHGLGDTFWDSYLDDLFDPELPSALKNDEDSLEEFNNDFF